MTWTLSSKRPQAAGNRRRDQDSRRVALGFGRAEIEAAIGTMQRSHFYKSMTSYADQRVWQDVYHVPSAAGTLYVKFTADAVCEFSLLSFKGEGP